MKASLFVGTLLCLATGTLAWDEALVTGSFYCSILPEGHWIPNSTHLTFWDNGRIWDNILLEFDLSNKNQTIDVTLNNGIFGLRPYLTIVHFCTENNIKVEHEEKLQLGKNYLGRYNLANAI